MSDRDDPFGEQFRQCRRDARVFAGGGHRVLGGLLLMRDGELRYLRGFMVELGMDLFHLVVCIAASSGVGEVGGAKPLSELAFVIGPDGSNRDFEFTGPIAALRRSTTGERR